jgi:hypothetical protein
MSMSVPPLEGKQSDTDAPAATPGTPNIPPAQVVYVSPHPGAASCAHRTIAGPPIVSLPSQERGSQKRRPEAKDRDEKRCRTCGLGCGNKDSPGHTYISFGSWTCQVPEEGRVFGYPLGENARHPRKKRSSSASATSAPAASAPDASTPTASGASALVASAASVPTASTVSLPAASASLTPAASAASATV